MKGTYLGEFEEIVLLAVAALQKEAYGLAIKKDLEEQTDRKITISAIHAACNRMETKGYLVAEFGEKSERRGGKRRKIYAVTMAGQEAMRRSQELRARLWQRIPATNFNPRLA